MWKKIYTLSQYKNRVFIIFKNFFIIHIKDDKSIGFFSVAPNTAKDDCATCIAYSLFTNSTEFAPKSWGLWIFQWYDVHIKVSKDTISWVLKKRGPVQEPEFRVESNTPNVLIQTSILIQWSSLRIPRWFSSVSFPLFSQTFFFLSFRSFILDPANQNQGSVKFRPDVISLLPSVVHQSAGDH